MQKHSLIPVIGVSHSHNVKCDYKNQYNDSPISCYRSKKQTVEKNYAYNSMGKEIFPIGQIHLQPVNDFHPNTLKISSG